MDDIIALASSNKVAVPAALFALLSPGAVLQLPDKIPGQNLLKNSLFTEKTSRNAVLFHALVFAVVYHLIARMKGMSLKPADLIVPTVLFVMLSPGMLLTLPPGAKGPFMSGETSITAILTHTIVFALVFAILRKNFPKVY